MKTVQTVEEYLKLFPEVQRTVLEKIRRTIKETAPEAEEVISYGMPGYKLNGALVYFGGFKDHCSFFPASYSVVREFEDDLKNYKTLKGTVQLPWEKPIPATLIRKMVKARIKENKLKQEAKANKKQKT